MRYYYKDENNNYYSLLEPNNELTQITEEEYNNHMATVENAMYNNVDINKINIAKKIKELQVKIRSTDYKAIKYAEGLYSDEEYAPTKELRESLREQIRELQKQL